MVKPLYATLGLDQEKPTEQEIQKAFHKLALKFHPDKNIGNEKLAEMKFQKINNAYEILSDPEKKKLYDSGEINEQGKRLPSASASASPHSTTAFASKKEKNDFYAKTEREMREEHPHRNKEFTIPRKYFESNLNASQLINDLLPILKRADLNASMHYDKKSDSFKITTMFSAFVTFVKDLFSSTDEKKSSEKNQAQESKDVDGPSFRQ